MIPMLQGRNRFRSRSVAMALLCIAMLCFGAAAQAVGMPVTLWDVEADSDPSESLFEDMVGSPRDLVFADPMAFLCLVDGRPIPHVLLDHSLFRPPSLLPLS